MNIKKRIKKTLKESPIIFSLSIWAIHLYIRFCYATSRWKYDFPEKFSRDEIQKLDGILFAVWHNNLAFAIQIFSAFPEIKALASPHSDGRIIGKVINKFGFEIIEGSTNKEATRAIREIIVHIKHGVNIVITPDGPRGPAHVINSSITKLAYKLHAPLIAASCQPSRYYELKSWDKMKIPKPFSTISVKFSWPLKLTGNQEKDDLLLSKALM